MKTTLILLFFTSAMLLSACNNGQSTSTVDQSLSYEYVEGSCDTKPQHFNSMASLCRGLQDNALNGGCALSLREQSFANDCPGQVFLAF